MSLLIDQFFCHNKDCFHYGVRSQGNLSFCGWSGRKKEIRMVRCCICKKRYSERKGTALFNSKLPKEKAISVYDHLKDGCGVRATSRLVKVSKDTVTRYSHKAGKHAKAVHDELVTCLPETREIQLDEKWGYVKKTIN